MRFRLRVLTLLVLSRPAFATLNAQLDVPSKSLRFALTRSNVTNVYAQPYTLSGLGVPYAGPHGAIATDAYPLSPARVVFTVSRNFP